MELSQFSDYSLRVLIYVSLNEEELSSVKQIAEAYQISQHHLVKVVHKLGQLGYLETQRGRGGGISLAMDAREIVVGDVIRKTENLALVECMPGRDGACCISPVCKLKGVLTKAKNAFLEELDRYTIADLVTSPKKLREHLAIPE